jgi:hypothetical protein
VLPEGLAALELERLADQRVVAHLGMRVERQVITGERHVVVEQDAQPLLHRRRDRARVKVPEQPVVGDHELRAGLGGALEEIAVGRDARGHDADLARARNL